LENTRSKIVKNSSECQDEMAAPCGAAMTMFFMSSKKQRNHVERVLHKNNILINTLIDENKCKVILRIVPVKIRGKTTIETYDLCVETSTTTLIGHQTAKCIGLQGTTVPFCCEKMSKVTKRYDTSEKVGFEISGMTNGAK
jgi:hypothetical protein